jgi:hypothetical protein
MREYAKIEAEVAALEAAWPPNGSVESPVENVLRNPVDIPIGKFFEYEIENVEWCCDKMRSKAGTTDTFIEEDRVEGEGISRRWYGKCPYCDIPLVFSVSGFCIDKDPRKKLLCI